MGSKSEEIAGWVDGDPARPHDPHDTDPKLLRENSEIRSFTTSRFTYPSIRVFYRRHPKANDLPTRPSLPLLVFNHGIGGSVAQFHPLLTSLAHLSSCLAIDMPGCGRSELAPQEWDAYSFEALTELLDVIIEDYRKREDPEGTVVLVGQSLGGALSARLASHHEPGKTKVSDHVVGLVATCPVTTTPPENMTFWYSSLLYIPEFIINAYQAWNNWGGLYSAGVNRWVGPDAPLLFRKLQQRFNYQTSVGVLRRVAWGAIPTYRNGVQIAGINSQEVWKHIDVPVLLVAGEDDDVTKPEYIEKIATVLSSPTTSDRAQSDLEEDYEVISEAAAAVPVDTAPQATGASKNGLDNDPRRASIGDIREADFSKEKSIANPADGMTEDPSTPEESSDSGAVPLQPRHPRKTVKMITLPKPANHALIYMPSTVRVLAGIISEFLEESITHRLSLGWQLQYLSREGKWDVKNLEKWRKVVPVSFPIGRPGSPVFRAMKTLRETDEVHSPGVFVKNWSGIITDVIDISHDQPVYDALTMERAGIKYHKFSTVSKIPPRDAEVSSFIQMVDTIRKERNKKAFQPDQDTAEETESVASKQDELSDERKPVIGVHCHYGFNRTGYFLVCYLVERCGFGVQEAIETFAEARPNGIRHSHFLDQLFVRYSGL